MHRLAQLGRKLPAKLLILGKIRPKTVWTGNFLAIRKLTHHRGARHSYRSNWIRKHVASEVLVTAAPPCLARRRMALFSE